MNKRPTAVAIGMFDGVHTGHRYIIERLREIASRNDLEPAVVTFENHPLTVIRPEKIPPVITDIETRKKLIRSLGIDNIIILPFTPQLREMTARRFAEEVLVGHAGASALLLGYDNGFGSDRLRSAEAYREALRGLDMDVYECPPKPGGNVSSTMVRKALQSGDVAAANTLLGHPYTITGTVTHGRQLGRTIGFPTANLSAAVPPVLANGVYAAYIVAPGELYMKPAMLNIGTAPTVNGTDSHAVTIEVHIITDAGTDAELPSELNLYGVRMTVAVMAKLRDEKRFGSLDELRSALETDRATALSILSAQAHPPKPLKQLQ